jgi:hypothetical protein
MRLRYLRRPFRVQEQLCGISARSATGLDTLGLRDYSEGIRLLTKFGKYEFAYRQKGGAVWPGYDTLGPAEWSLVYDIRLGKLATPKQQSVLKRSLRQWNERSAPIGGIDFLKIALHPGNGGNWGWRQFAEWRREGVMHKGVRRAAGHLLGLQS